MQYPSHISSSNSNINKNMLYLDNRSDSSLINPSTIYVDQSGNAVEGWKLLRAYYYHSNGGNFTTLPVPTGSNVPGNVNTSLVSLSLGSNVAPKGHINLGLLTQDIKAFNGTDVGNKGGSGSKSKWWHEGYVDDLSDTQTILGVKQSDKGLSTLGSTTKENAVSAGKAWVGKDYNIIKDNAGNVLGYSSADGMREFRIQYNPKEGMWRANFQENMMVNNPYPNPGQHSSQLKNVHIDIID